MSNTPNLNLEELSYNSNKTYKQTIENEIIDKINANNAIIDETIEGIQEIVGVLSEDLDNKASKLIKGYYEGNLLVNNPTNYETWTVGDLSSISNYPSGASSYGKLEYIPYASNGATKLKYTNTNPSVPETLGNVYECLYNANGNVMISDWQKVANNTDLENKADLGEDGKVLSSQLPTISTDAENITITDENNYYTSDNVEGALEEIGLTLEQKADLGEDGKVLASQLPDIETITVEDNLTSTSTTSALSAKQGKVLNETKAPSHQVGTSAPASFVGEGVLYGVY